MIMHVSYPQNSDKHCLTDDEFYLYVTHGGDDKRRRSIEEHISECPDCRRALAEILEILPKGSAPPEEEIPGLTAAEMDETVAVIRDTARKERSSLKNFCRRAQWPIAAAVVMGFAFLAFWGVKSYYDWRKARGYYIQAKALLEQQYTGRSPHNLRLSLPFKSATVTRSADTGDMLQKSVNLFHQAIAVRDDYMEARLGIAAGYLSEAKFALARDTFQQILDRRSDNLQALVGRGVARYEEAIETEDPVRYRSLMAGALEDFDRTLKIDPGSMEALYDRAWALFQTGSYEEALSEIERYLSRDDTSVWAAELKNLKVRIRAGRSGVLKQEVDKAASVRDRDALEAFARMIPSLLPAAIWQALGRRLALEQPQANRSGSEAADLLWAAKTMESVYRNITGDSGFEGLIEYYGDLSPPERAQKKMLDKTFQQLAALQAKNDYESILQKSAPLKESYLDLHDFWQLYNLQHLRGHCFYEQGDFNNACKEYSEMLDFSRRTGSDDLIARSLASLATVSIQQKNFDQTDRYLRELREIAQTPGLDSWMIYVDTITGYQYQELGQPDRSLKEYASALRSAYGLVNEGKIVEVLERTGAALDRLGQFQDAMSFYDATLQRIESYAHSRGGQVSPEIELQRLNLIYKLGEISLRSGNPDTAVSYFTLCLESIKSGKNELEARNLIGLAGAYMKLGRSREAGSALDKVEAVNVSEQHPEIAWQTWYLRGRLEEDAGDYKNALESQEKAIGIVESIRRDIESTEKRHAFLSNRFDPYRKIVEILFTHDRDEQRALDYVDRAKSITLREYLHLADPDSGPNPKLVKSAPGGNGYRILEYFFTGDGLLVFVTGPEGGIIDAVSLKLSEETAEKQVGDLKAAVAGANPGKFSAVSRKLYDGLVAPVEKVALEGYSGPLVILPDGPLHLLPFAGLQDGTGTFLIEKNPVVYSPSRSVFRHCLSLDRDRKSGADSGVVLIDGTANLPSAREELVYLSGLYNGRTRVLEAEDLPQFSRAVAGCGILHFSGHAVSGQDNPALMLRQFPDTAYLDSGEIGSWKMSRCRLVNLAGCSTGVGPVAEGESPWGLVPAFLNAGAPAIVASLMQVDDSATTQLSRRFYESLQEGNDKATALRKAQLAILDRSSKNALSLSWVPYILIGNPQ